MAPIVTIGNTFSSYLPISEVVLVNYLHYKLLITRVMFYIHLGISGKSLVCHGCRLESSIILDAFNLCTNLWYKSQI